MEGKVALVTGGSSGIGRAAALAFAKRGAKVVVADVDGEGGEETVGLIRAIGSDAIFVRADVSKASDVEAMVNQTIETYGRLDYAHNNAGIEGEEAVPTAKASEENWDRIININLKGVWLGMKYEIPRMKKQGGGAIVNTASIAGLVGGPLASAYSASKAGILGLTRVAAVEYAAAKIRVNAVCPGVIRTPLIDRILAVGASFGFTEETYTSRHPIGRLGTPEEIAEAVVWLCSDGASFVTGHALAVDGGYVAQ